MSVARRAIVVLLVLISCVGCDRVSKSYAESRLSETKAISFFSDSVRLQLSYNAGAFLSLGSSLPKPWRQAIFFAGVGCVLCGLLAYALFARSRWSILGASLVFAGGASNLLDRLLYDGYVVDFINVGVGLLRTGIFNLADMVIMAGTLLMLVDAARARRGRS
jgi:signal peptidase II